jgi:L-ribulose-5-phosphate 4-epimerase
VLIAISNEFGGPIPVGAYAAIGGDAIMHDLTRSIGKTVEVAVKAAVMVEDAARTVFHAMQVGVPEPIPESDIALMHRHYLEHYGQ